MQMELNVREIAGRLKHNNEMAESHLDEIRSFPELPAAVVAEKLKQYIAAKLLLEEDEVSDNIIEMVRSNVAKASHMTIEQLKEMDRPGRCGSAPAVLSKRVMVYLDIQKNLGITLPAKDLPEVRTVQELTDMILQLPGISAEK